MLNTTYLFRGVSSLALSMMAIPALAQTGGAPGPVDVEQSRTEVGNDIIVTARQFKERLQDVPIAVSTINAQDLKRQGIDDLSDIAEKTVGFSFEAISPLVVQPAIRGQVNLRTTSPVQNVAVYLDGNYLQRGYLIDQGLIELEQVEIIKGPQSALYGRNAFAGAINLKTLSPSLTEAHGNVSGTIGTFGRYDARGYLMLPIIKDRLAILVSAAHSQFEGTWANNHPLANADGALTQGNLGGWNKETYQARVIAKPTDWLKIDASYIRTEREIDAPANYLLSTIGRGSNFNTLNASLVSGQNRLFVGEIPFVPTLAPGETRSPGLTVDPRAYGLRGPTDVATAKVELTPGGPISATYQFGFTSAKIVARGSANRDPLAPLLVAGVNFGVVFDSSGTDSSFKGYSHEVRFTYDTGGKLHLLAGVNYSKTDDIESNANEFAPVNSLVAPDPAQIFPVGAGLPFPAGTFQRSVYLKRTDNIYSMFGFAGYDFTDKLTATVEGRFTIEDHEIRDYLTRQAAPNAAVQGPPVLFQSTEHYFTPRGTISYKLSNENTVYLSAARGVKSGGLNGNVPFVPQQAYVAERNSTYEIGSKNSFFGRRVTLNLSAYHVDWSNVQSNSVRLQANGTPPPFTFNVPSITGNIGGIKVNGVEAEGSIRIAPPLTFDFGASYNRSRYAKGTQSQRFGASGNCNGIVCATTPGTPTAALSIAGNQLERVPEFDSRAGFTLEGGAGQPLTYYLRGDVSYQTKSFVDEANLAFVSDRFLINASAGLRFKGFSVSAYVKNLANTQYVSSSLFLIGTAGALSSSYVPNLGEKRTIGLIVSGGF